MSSEPGNADSVAVPLTLWAEYNLIQSKIDKIGDFEFKIKGWSAALLGAVLYGGAKISQVGIALASALLLAIAFHLVEARQHSHTRKLGQRALDLERALRSFPPTPNRRFWDAIVHQTPSLRYTPGVARALARKEKGVFRRLIKRGNHFFYVIQYVLLTCLLAAHFASFSFRRIGTALDPLPRYEITIWRYHLVVYRESDQ
jgi:hypothetical protein